MAYEQSRYVPSDADEATKKQYGFTTDAVPGGGYTGQAYDDRRYRGLGNYQENGWMVPGTSGADIEAARYRGLGAAPPQAPVAIDRTRSNQSRGLVMGSLGHLAGVASGQDSEALRLGQDQAKQAALGQQSMAASVRGGAMARAAAARTADRNIARSNAQIANYARAGQAAEMAAARGELMRGSTGLRAQDLGFAGSQADLAAKQRAMDEYRQQTYEGLASDVTDAELFARIEAQRQNEQQQLAHRQQQETQRQQDLDEAMTVAQIGLSTGAAMMSDVRTKMIPVGSLAHLMR